ncbi:LADA_0G09296g1_1 [Lachancea dasiensis]|uniref:aromatic-amino-acid transaminase n=1 Tax=Lachancea dasiensis TaxID=1072105 RepID=A0A1G4JUJ7_9SACH|nr:LADA_0G09296g1_1 [Lachancea dasiensis]
MLPVASNFSHKLSIEARTRVPSPMEGLNIYLHKKNLVFLAGGMPMAEFFPWDEITAKSPIPKEGSTIESMRLSANADVCITSVRKSGSEFPGDIPLSRSLQYGATEGEHELLSFIREHTRSFHNPKYSNWDVVATTGSTQAWEATLRVFCNRGDSILVEYHSYTSPIYAAQAQGINVVHVPLDEEGIVPAALEEKLRNWHHSLPFPKLLYIIPTGQNPTGSTLGGERRKQVYRIAQAFDLIIVEDEPYYFLQMDQFTTDVAKRKNRECLSHERFKELLVDSFLSMDTDGRVIRLESFSKILSPGARLGWIVGSQDLLRTYIHFQELTVHSPSGFAQTMVAGLLNRWGHQGYTNWLIALRAEYSKRRDVVCDALLNHLPSNPAFRFMPPTAGMFFTVKIDASCHPGFQQKYDGDPIAVEKMLFERFSDNGVLVVPSHWFKKIPEGPDKSRQCENNAESAEIFFRGTYAAVDLNSLEQGVKALSETLKSEFTL